MNAKNRDLNRIVVDHCDMDPQLFSLDGSPRPVIRIRDYLLHHPHNSSVVMVNTLQICCTRLKFIEQWLLSQDTKAEQARTADVYAQASENVIGVVVSILTTQPSSPVSVFYEQLRAMRNFILHNKEFFDFKDYVQTLDQKGLHDYMIQLDTQEGLKWNTSEGTASTPTLAPRHELGVRQEFIS